MSKLPNGNGETLNRNSKHPSAALKSTRWCVITGAPCSGKTAVIEGLGQRGYRVIPEAARAYIDSQLAAGRTLQEIKADPLSFERLILMRKVQLESSLPASDLIFLDRGIPDSIAYFQLENLPITEPLLYSRNVRYAKVFLFDRLHFETDSVRAENSAMAAHIETLLISCYQALGYAMTRVPVMPIEQRIQWVARQALR